MASFRKNWTKCFLAQSGIPWRTIKLVVISAIFAITVIFFSLQPSPDEHEHTHFAAVSQATPLFYSLSPSKPLDTVKVYITVQQISQAVRELFPSKVYVNVSLQGFDTTDVSTRTGPPSTSSSSTTTPPPTSNLNGTWVTLEEKAVDPMTPGHAAMVEQLYFYLTDSDRSYSALRLNVSTPTVQSVGLEFKVLQLSHWVRYQVSIGIAVIILVYLLIIFELVHRTLAALIGSFWALAALALVEERPSFHEVISWIDYDTIGLLFGMMILVGIFSTTGFFEWSAIKAYKMSGGDVWRLIVMLCVFTGVTSSFLDNVTAMLLVAPVTLRLCSVIDIRPIPVLLAEVIFSNIGGTATGIGDPPNILIISNDKMQASELIDFTTFTLHVAPGAVLAFIATLYFVRRQYRAKLCERPPRDILAKEIDVWRRTLEDMDEHGDEEQHIVREKLMDYVVRLEHLKKTSNAPASSVVADKWDDERGQFISLEQDDNYRFVDTTELEAKYVIKDEALLIKSCAVIGIVILLFFLHPFIHVIELSLPWIALIGAMFLLVISGIDDLHEVLEKVELMTLLFFAGLFVLMRCLEEMGVMLYIADRTASMISIIPEGRLRLSFAVLAVMWVCAIVSAFIDNIPFTTTMIPIVYKLSQSGLGLPLQPLTWAMAFGACLGGNGTLVGASANVVAAGVAEQHGSHVSFAQFFAMGFPCMIISTCVASFYVLFSHVLIPWYSG